MIPFTGSDVQKTIKREFVIFEFEETFVAITHLDGGDGEKVAATHLEEINQIKQYLNALEKPVLLFGDLNEDRYKESTAYQALVDKRDGFVDCIADQRPGERIITCSDELKIARFGESKTPTEESIDFVGYRRKDEGKVDLTFKGAVDSDLSDHRQIEAIV